MTFGALLKQLRQKHGYTQRYVAEALAVDFTYISKIENGRTPYPPSERLIEGLATLYNVDAAYLLDQSALIDTYQLRQLAVKHPEVATLLRRIQKATMPEIKAMLDGLMPALF